MNRRQSTQRKEKKERKERFAATEAEGGSHGFSNVQQRKGRKKPEGGGLIGHAVRKTGTRGAPKKGRGQGVSAIFYLSW